ncbi:MAG: DUF1835 domain-containing protein [Lentisphaeria bacterium]
MRQINLFNEDCAANEWRLCQLPGDFLVWRKNYLRGKLPDTNDLSEFNRIRSAELHKIAPEFPETDILRDLEKMHDTLLSLTPCDQLTLWFDTCPYDQIMLTRILALLANRKQIPQITLIQKNLAWNKNAFLKYHTHGSTITTQNLNQAKKTLGRDDR